jgi:hypothetical protein
VKQEKEKTKVIDRKDQESRSQSRSSSANSKIEASSSDSDDVAEAAAKDLEESGEFDFNDTVTNKIKSIESGRYHFFHHRPIRSKSFGSRGRMKTMARSKSIR